MSSVFTSGPGPNPPEMYRNPFQTAAAWSYSPFGRRLANYHSLGSKVILGTEALSGSIVVLEKEALEYEIASCCCASVLFALSLVPQAVRYNKIVIEAEKLIMLFHIPHTYRVRFDRNEY